MDIGLGKSKQRLDQALNDLENFIQSASKRIKFSNIFVKDEHIKTLNQELQIENANLKQQLFVELKNINNIHSNNKIAHKEIDILIDKLEKLLD